MDFGNPKKLRIVNDLHPISGSEAFGGGRGGGGFGKSLKTLWHA